MRPENALWSVAVAARTSLLLLMLVGSCLIGLAPSALAQAEAVAPADAPEQPPSPGTVTKQAEQARVAEPTPIVPSPGDPLRPAFQLYAEFDLPVLGIGLVFAAARLTRAQKAYCAPLCEPGELNALDRTTAGYWSPAWQLTSDIGLYTIGVGAAVLLVADEGLLDALNDGVVIAESALAAIATASIMTLATSRPRPFLYGEDAPLSDRNSSDASLSFLSSHTAVAFAITTSTVMTMRRLHPKGALPWVVAGVGGALSTMVAVARVMAGKHFITDVTGGAIVGTSLGVLIPALHGSPVKLVPGASASHAGLSVVGRF